MGDCGMIIRKTYRDEPGTDPVYLTFDELREHFESKGEPIEWINYFIGALEEFGEASDRFAEYRVEEN